MHIFKIVQLIEERCYQPWRGSLLASYRLSCNSIANEVGVYKTYFLPWWVSRWCHQAPPTVWVWPRVNKYKHLAVYTCTRPVLFRTNTSRNSTGMSFHHTPISLFHPGISHGYRAPSVERPAYFPKKTREEACCDERPITYTHTSCNVCANIRPAAF